MAQSTLESLLQSKTDDINDSIHKPLLIDYTPKSKQFLAARNKIAESSKPNNQFLPLYPIFKDPAIHSVIVSDLKAVLDASGPAQHKKNAVPMPPTLQLETKHKVFLSLLRVQLSSSVSDIVESLQLLKQILSTPSSQSPDSIEA